MQIGRRAVWLWLLCIAAIVVSGKLAGHSAARGRSIGIADSEGCEFRVNIPARSKVDDRLDLVLTLTNNGGRGRTWGEVNGLRDCIIRVYNDGRERVPYTTHGAEQLETAGYSTYRQVITTLAPGDLHEWRLNLSEFFQFRSGKFTLTAWVDLDIPDGPRLKVQHVPFEIL